jgi:hypothetical protein
MNIEASAIIPQFDEQQLKLKSAVESLIDAGCNYRLFELEKLYSPELKIVMLQPDSTIVTFNYEQNMDFFRKLRDSCAPPLDKTVKFNHIELAGDYGFVIVTRKIALGSTPQTIVFNLMLTRASGSWQVFREHSVILGEA